MKPARLLASTQVALRRGTAAARRELPERRNLQADALAGLSGSISSVPDGMAASVLAGVNPVHGLYACFAGRIGGGLSTSTKLMVVTTTSAAALAAGNALAPLPADRREGALLLLTLIAGAAMLAAGVLRLGRYTRFVPHSVMIGFLTGVAANIVFGQIPDLLGYSAQGSYNLAKAIDALRHVSSSAVPSLLTGACSMAIIVLLSRTRLSSVAPVLALIVPTLLVVLLGADSVARVSDAGAIPHGLPVPQLPRLRELTFSVLTGALAVAAIVLVQGAGVAESAPNPDGRLADADRDFVGQGVGNVASALFQGQPVGGSVGQTAINLSAGARSRWAGIFSGAWMLVILLVFAGPVGKVAVPTLSGVLVVAAVGSVRVGQISTIWRTHLNSKVGMLTTFLATLFLPVAAAVGIGVAVGLLLQLNREALDLRVVQLVPTGRPDVFEQRDPPTELASRAVTVLDIYGSLYYAGARTLQTKLPDPGPAHAAAVVLRLRGRTTISSTFVVVIEDYLRRVRAGGGRLYLSGVDPSLAQQIGRFERFGAARGMRVFPAEVIIGASTQAAYDRAAEWLRENAG